MTSYTVNAADFTVLGYGFQLDHNYSIEIGLIQTKDGSSVNLGNANLKAIPRVYADFRPTQAGGPTVNLPVVLSNGSFLFNFAVVAGQTYSIDPAVAVGYDYRIGSGNPNFKSVLLPTGIGDKKYDIFGLSALGQTTLLAHDWLGGAMFDFAGLGVDAFRIGGIEASAGLDPSNVTAFVTGLTFEGDGVFTGTQSPLTLDVAAVPEPETWAMLLGMSTSSSWRRQRSHSAWGNAARSWFCRGSNEVICQPSVCSSRLYADAQTRVLCRPKFCSLALPSVPRTRPRATARRPASP